MEVQITDLKKIKLSPSLIILLKSIYYKDEEFIIELNKVADVFTMARFLEKKMILKITGDKLSYNSFEIRNLAVIKYLDNLDNLSINNDVDEVINYFKEITGKNRISNKSEANRKFIAARLKEYTVQDLKDVIDLKFKQWKNDSSMSKYLRIETIFNATKFQSYIGELDSNKPKDFYHDI